MLRPEIELLAGFDFGAFDDHRGRATVGRSVRFADLVRRTSAREPHFLRGQRYILFDGNLRGGRRLRSRAHW